jgi:hypothetical protein
VKWWFDGVITNLAGRTTNELVLERHSILGVSTARQAIPLPTRDRLYRSGRPQVAPLIAFSARSVVKLMT